MLLCTCCSVVIAPPALPAPAAALPLPAANCSGDLLLVGLLLLTRPKLDAAADELPPPSSGLLRLRVIFGRWLPPRAALSGAGLLCTLTAVELECFKGFAACNPDRWTGSTLKPRADFDLGRLPCA